MFQFILMKSSLALRLDAYALGCPKINANLKTSTWFVMCVQIINVLFSNNTHLHHTIIVGYFIIMIIVIKYVLIKLNACNWVLPRRLCKDPMQPCSSSSSNNTTVRIQWLHQNGHHCKITNNNCTTQVSKPLISCWMAQA